MILPSKHLRQDRALLGIGAELLGMLSEPITVSRLWNDFDARRQMHADGALVTYDWFILALDLLFLVGVVDFSRGRVRRVMRS